MPLDDRFDDLIASLGGFHRTWLVYLGLELGLFRHLRDAGPTGLTVDDLAAQAGCRTAAVEVWAWAADAHELATLEGGRLTVDEDVAVIVLDEGRPDYLGGQFIHAAVASLDWGGMVDFFRSGEPIKERPDRYRVAIERLTAQDIAVFFQEALAELPQLVADLVRGGRVVDVHCGGGRWLIAMARRFPALELVGSRIRGGLGRARPSQRRGGRPLRSDHDPAGGRHRSRQGRRIRSGLFPVRAPPGPGRAGRAPGRMVGAPPLAGDSSSSTGRCRQNATSSGRGTAS